MKIVKNLICYMSALVIMISTISLNVSADGSFKNMEQASYSEREDFTFEICRAIVAGDATAIKNYTDYFEPECYAYIIREVPDINGGNIISYVNDYIRPQNSSNGDFVTMSNLILMYNNEKHAMCVELHYNKEGLIYGYNFWQY